MFSICKMTQFYRCNIIVLYTQVTTTTIVIQTLSQGTFIQQTNGYHYRTSYKLPLFISSGIQNPLSLFLDLNIDTCYITIKAH